MHITVNELVNSQYMKNAQILAGRNGLERQISAIAVLDAPDGINYVKGNELIVSSSYAIVTIENKSSIITELAKAGAAAFGVKSGRFIGNIPDEMIVEANRLNFPLIEIPVEIAWTDLISAFFNHLLSLQIKINNFNAGIHERFTEAVLHGKGVIEIVRSLHELTDMKVFILDEHLQISCCQGINESEIRVNEKLNQFIQTIKYDSVQTLPYHDNIAFPAIMFNPIFVGNSHYGFLVVLQDQYIEPMMQKHYIRAIEYASTVIALEVSRKIIREEIERRMIGNFVHDLLFSNYDKETILRRAKFWGYEGCQEYVFIVIDINNFAQYIRRENLSEEEITKLREDTLNRTKSFFQRRNKKVYFGLIDDSIIVFYLLVKETNHELYTMSKSLLNDLKYGKQKISFSVGISRISRNIEDAPRVYEEACKAASLGKRIDPKEEVFFINRLQLYLILSETNEQLIYELITERFGKLLETSSEQLLHTLEVFFECGMNSKLTAEKMFLHPKTVKYRIDKISSILDINFSNQEERLLIELMTKCLRLYIHRIEDVN